MQRYNKKYKLRTTYVSDSLDCETSSSNDYDDSLVGSQSEGTLIGDLTNQMERLSGSCLGNDDGGYGQRWQVYPDRTDF